MIYQTDASLRWHDSTEEDPYNISQWSAGYFKINSYGNLIVNTSNKTCQDYAVELKTIVDTAKQAGLQLPLLMHFTDILQDRVTEICTAFAEAILENNYQGKYKLVYPIKVNQQQSVIQSLLANHSYSLGLEAGSKSELMAVIGLLKKTPSTIVCNGYKDSNYIRIAFIAQQMGHEVFIVIEKSSELDLVLKEYKNFTVKPKLGVRIRLVTKGAGKWEDTAGSKSKFGLNVAQLLDLIQQLKTHNALHHLQLIHCHLGSQVANILDIRYCIQEIARYYVELRQLQAPINTIDVGGGLGVDYEGTHSTAHCSVNYSIKEYAASILLTLQHMCQTANLPEPNLISESGRALTAHHAVLVTNIIDVEVTRESPLPLIQDSESHVLQDIWKTYQSMPDSVEHETYNYATYALDEANSAFKHGLLNLADKYKVEQFFTAICLGIQQKLLAQGNSNNHELLDKINERLAAKIFCNLSFFQSIPDAWAIRQVFPIVPLTQLNEKKQMHCILQDLTCDSDGTIKEYLGQQQVQSTLLLPIFNANDPYYLAFFLVGAYQEILGNLHNLFGKINTINITLIGNGKFEINHLILGDKVENVLHYNHYMINDLLLSYQKQLNATALPATLIRNYLAELNNMLQQLTYLATETPNIVSLT